MKNTNKINLIENFDISQSNLESKNKKVIKIKFK